MNDINFLAFSGDVNAKINDKPVTPNVKPLFVIYDSIILWKLSNLKL